MKTYTAVIASAFSITLAGIIIFTLSKSPLSGDISNGKAKYDLYCLSCHGARGHGDGIASAELTNKPANIASKINAFFATPNSLANDVILGNVEEGMPSWEGVLSNQDATDILTYIQNIQ